MAANDTEMKDLFAEHNRVRLDALESALAETGFDALLLHAGRPSTYFADDMDAPFHETPHFAHWVPLAGPHHLLLVRPGEPGHLVRVAPEDYWYEQAALGHPFFESCFRIEEVGSADRAWKSVPREGRVAYVGDSPDLAAEQGIARDAINPPSLVARLDWDRSYKTPYEVACLRVATEMAARGHLAAKSAFEADASELEIHHAYVAATGCVDSELPYETIVCHDEKGAILHYTGKRTSRGGRVLLIDAGARHMGYASDITRTWTREGCDETFREIVEGLEGIQLELCEAVCPGLAYSELHHRAHVAIGDLLSELGVLEVGGETAVEAGITSPFFPHGLGHFLGIQVHDVAGHQAERSGGTAPPPEKHPFLRTTRMIEANQVFTIEPGVYFIEMLLREYRNGPSSKLFDWDVVDRLTPFGGVRIEDNVLVTKSGHDNLTRPHLPLTVGVASRGVV